VRFDLERIGKAAGAVDQLIAGHAISLGLVLVTDNLKHFKNVPGLKLENWL
jgi:tRNA(fMet)-specific endonuclease VapC